MILHDKGILQAITDGEIEIQPFNMDNVKPSSYDVRLGNQFAIINTLSGVIDPKHDNSERVHKIEVPKEGYFYLKPHEFVLASTVEIITLGVKVAGRIEGKSSLGRLGLMVHSTAGFIDPGFSGEITLELSNMLDVPIKLYPGMPVAQICVMRMQGEATSYAVKGKYMGQTGPVPSRYHQNFK